MASAYWDVKQWVADFRGLGQVDKQRRRARLDPKKVRDKKTAQRVADECEHYCRLLEGSPAPDPHDIDHAERIKAITAEQASALRAGLPPPPQADPHQPLTIKAAAMLHPSTKREEKERPGDVIVYLRHVDAFCTFAGYAALERLTSEDVLRWIDQLKDEGLSWDARRHRLLYIRRASKMGATKGLSDALAELALDRRGDEEPAVEAWTLDELALAAHLLEDPRALAALGLMGFAGERPSECRRHLVGDFRGDLVEVGKRKAKNRASKRTLPLPAIVRRWCEAAAGDRDPSEPLIVSRAPVTRDGRTEGKPPRPLSDTSLAQWLKPLLAEATGRSLKVKCLRKSFTTWGEAVVPGRDLGRYLGHVSAMLAAVTSSRYMGPSAAAELRPALELLDEAIAAAMAKARPRALKLIRDRTKRRAAEAEAAARAREERRAAYLERQRESKARWVAAWRKRRRILQPVSPKA